MDNPRLLGDDPEWRPEAVEAWQMIATIVSNTFARRLAEGEHVAALNEELFRELAAALEMQLVPNLASLQAYWRAQQSSIQLVAVAPEEWEVASGNKIGDLVTGQERPYWLAVLYQQKEDLLGRELLERLAANEEENLRRLRGKTGILTHDPTSFPLLPEVRRPEN